MSAKRLFGSTLVLMMSLALAGCVTPAGTKNVVTTNFDRSITINNAQTKVWGDTLEWLALNGFPITKTDKEAGVITIEGSGVTTWVFWPKQDEGADVENELVSCGEATGNIGLYKGQFSDMNILGNILVRAGNGGTRVTVNLFGTAVVEVRNLIELVSRAQTRCKSKGVFEAKLFEYLKSL